jgi:TRAP transporter 4TM/12TM fusion protein
MGATPIYLQRGVALLLSLILGVMVKPTKSRRFPLLGKLYDVLVLVLAVLSFGYVIVNSATIPLEIGMRNTKTLIASVAGILVITELGRRWVPPSLTWLNLAVLAYALFGHLLPIPVFSHPKVAFEQLATYTMVSQEGILGVGVAVMVDIIFIFLVFSAMLKTTGIGTFFLDLARAAVGRYTGGPALAAVVGSSLFGMVSGSPVANVAAVGVITIPLMIGMGYSPVFAAAVESVASTGGQIMPPVLGSVAFFIAEVTGTPYVKIIKYAIIPALVYYGAAATGVWLEAKRLGLRGLPASELPNLRAVIKGGWYFLLPVAALVAFLVLGFTPQTSAWYATVVAACIAVLRKVRLRQFVEALAEAALNSLGVMMAVAVIGIFIASFALTGIAAKLVPYVSQVVETSYLLGMLIVAVFALILGLPLPPLPTYIVCYVALAPLIPVLASAVGIPRLAVHMFLFYYAAMAPLTPPIALAAFTASGIAQCDPMTPGWKGMLLALPGFAVPFLFLQHPELLLMGDLWPGLVTAMGKALLLMGLSALVAIGWLGRRLGIWYRLVAALSIVFLIVFPRWGVPVAVLVLALAVGPTVIGRFCACGRSRTRMVSASRPDVCRSAEGGDRS